MLSITNFLCDYYLCHSNKFNAAKFGRSSSKSSISKVIYPTLRIYGIQSLGEKCCAHIHGYLPYVTLRTRVGLTVALQNYIVDYVRQMMNRRHEDSKQRSDNFSSTSSFHSVDECLFGIFAEKGRSIYGFYEGESCFIKIYFYDPGFAKIFVTSLQKESDRIQWLQPYNSHIPFILQFFIDFCLSGMDFVHFKQTYHRKQPPHNIEGSGIYRTSSLPSSSHTSIEFDAYTDDIMNALTTQAEFESNGLAFIWSEERENCAKMGLNPPKCSQEEEKLLEDEAGCEGFAMKKMRGDFISFLTDLEKRGKRISQDTVENCDGGYSIIENPSASNFDDIATVEMVENEPTVEELESQRIWENQEYRLKGFDAELDEHEFGFENEQISQLIEREMSIADTEDLDEEEEEEVELIEPNLGHGERITTLKSPYSNLSQENVPIGNYDEIEQHRRIGINLVDDGEIDQQENCIRTLCLKKEIKLSFMPKNSVSFQKDAKSPIITTIPKFPLALDEQEFTLPQLQSSVAHLCALSLELIPFIGNSQPNRTVADPEFDGILAVVFAYHKDVCNWKSHDPETLEKHVILVEEPFKVDIPLFKHGFSFKFVATEKQLFEETHQFVKKLDPELLIGYDCKRYSWGYLFERAQKLQINLPLKISRIKDAISFAFSPFRAPLGRLLIEVWSNVRKEMLLYSYNFSNVAKELLGITFPSFDDTYQDDMFNTDHSGLRLTLVNLFMKKAVLNMRLLGSFDFFVRTSQMARVYGIQFEGVLTRGSQFRVESMLLRIAKKQRFFAPTVSVDQRNRMLSPECIPLTLEPESGIYRDPVIVLDFQSLYPSICIAYNYCFSTCIGKMNNLKTLLDRSAMINSSQGSEEFIRLGALPYQVMPLEWLREHLENGKITFAPNGALFVKKDVRHGLLPILLQELLDTRVMVKKAMKRHGKTDREYKIMDARQLALKLIANVTYGYTAANWSGRMPCEEVADAIVSTGRRALEKAMRHINGAPPDKYMGARVIYGDTDSLFVLCSGCSRAEAFQIGQQMAKDVTQLNVWPIKLKFEKVMHPCCLLSKKRYVGMSFEAAEEREGKFDAKGIETVRRDNPPFVAKTMERFLRLLFDESHLSALKFLEMHLLRLQHIEIDEFVHSIDFVGDYSDKSKSPAFKLALELTKISQRLTPLYGERLSYVVIAKERLFDATSENNTIFSCIVPVDDFLKEPTLPLNYNYYVRQQLFPALQRVLDHVPVRLSWSSFNPHQCCAGCHQPGVHPWCSECMFSRATFAKALVARVSTRNGLTRLRQMCRTCIQPVKSMNVEDMAHCKNFNCSVKRKYISTKREMVANSFNKHSFVALAPRHSTITFYSYCFPD